ncbi:uncharacterized protein ABDE67_010366 [Symphorus nematophorus]
MKMRLLLLFSAVTLLVGPAVVSSRHIHHDAVYLKLSKIYDLAENCKPSQAEDEFVEDVTQLAEGSNHCGDKFFCKVQDILQDKHFCDKKAEKIERLLKTYNTERNVTCERVLQGMTSPDVTIPVSSLLEKVKHCVQHRNMHGTK